MPGSVDSRAQDDFDPNPFGAAKYINLDSDQPPDAGTAILSTPTPPVATPPQASSFGLTWQQAAGKPEVTAKLPKLPEGLSFPDGFPEPIRYDAQQQLLSYRGFMTAMSYDYLRQLSDNLAYIAALDELNIKTSRAITGAPPRHQRTILWRLGPLLAASMATALWFISHWHWHIHGH